MNLSRQKYFATIMATLVVGLVGGYYVGYLPTHKDVEQYKYNFEYYRDKYLKECEIYKDIIHVAGNKQIDDYSKLYYIRSTYTQFGRSEEIERAIRLKKSIERNKEN